MAQTTEQKIFETTIKYIKQYGYQKLSLRKIAQNAGLTTGAFYKHFQNKDELFYRTAVELSKEVTAKVDINVAKGPFQRLLTLAQQFCQLFQEQPQIMDFLFFNPVLIDVYQQKDTDFAFLQLARELAHQVNPGYINDQQFFNQIWSFIQGYSLLIKNRITSYNPDLVALTLHQFVGGVKQ